MFIDIKEFFDSQEIEKTISNVVEIGELKVNGKNLEFDPIDLKGAIYLVDNSAYLSLDFSYSYIDQCDRCLATIKNEVETSWSARILTEESEETDDVQEQIILLADDFLLELEPQIKEAIIFSLPMKSLCTKDCKGICPECGQNLNEKVCSCQEEQVDDRFAKLKQLL